MSRLLNRIGKLPFLKPLRDQRRAARAKAAAQYRAVCCVAHCRANYPIMKGDARGLCPFHSAQEWMDNGRGQE